MGGGGGGRGRIRCRSLEYSCSAASLCRACGSSGRHVSPPRAAGAVSSSALSAHLSRTIHDEGVLVDDRARSRVSPFPHVRVSFSVPLSSASGPVNARGPSCIDRRLACYVRA